MIEIISIEAEKPAWLTAAEVSTLIFVSVYTLYSLVSHVSTYLKDRRGGYIQLPAPRAPALTRGEDLARQLLDNVDELPDDDGEYVEEDRFWRSAIPLRITFLLPVLATLAIQGIYGYRIITSGPGAWGWTSSVLSSVVCAYQAVISVVYASTKSIPRHTSLTYHLFNIALLLFFYNYMITLGQYLVADRHVELTWVEYSLFGLSLLQITLIGSIPCSPGRYYDLKRVYNKAVASALTKMEAEKARAEESTEAVGKGDRREANMVSEHAASVFSQLFTAWVVPVISKMSKLEQADITDLPGLHHYLRTQNTAREAISYSHTKISPERWGVTRAFLWEVWVPQWRSVLIVFILQFLLKPLWYLPHIALQRVLGSIELGHDRRTALAWAIIMVLSKIVGAVLNYIQLGYTSCYASLRIRAHAQHLLFSKLLTRNTFAKPLENKKPEEKGPASSKADILNLVSVDVGAISSFGFSSINLISNQLEMVLGATYVWILLGPSGAWGLATLLLTSVPAYFITKLQYKVYEKRLAVSDRKVTLLQEAVQAISMIKMMAAERFWFKRIKTVRDEEFGRLVHARLLGALSGLLYAASPTIIVVVSFAHYSLVAKKPLTATVAFTSIAVFEELRPILLSLPETIAECLQQILSAKRIGSFIQTRDVDYLNESIVDSSTALPDEPLTIHGTIAWDDDQPPQPSSTGDVAAPVAPGFRLQGIDLAFQRGQVTLVAGKFGSGKSMLLLALLGEARLIEGKISYVVSEMMPPYQGEEAGWDLIPTGVAYVPQTPWLQSLSIRDNILFGLPLNMERYKAVIFAVGLLPDLEILEDADLTEIGERGKILSGGQKARVSLARAVYSRASTLLLDDVISAVDAQTSQHIVRYCFRGPLMQGRTVIITSHAVESLAPLADTAVFFDAGRVIWQGTGAALMDSEHMAHLKDDQEESAAEDGAQRLLEKRRGSEKLGDVHDFEIKEAPDKTPKQLVLEESRAKGNINLELYRDLIKINGGTLFWVFMGVLLLSSALAPVAERRILELWTDAGVDPKNTQRVVFWVALYSGLSVANIVLDAIFGLYRFFGGLRATKRVHSEMLETVLRAKMSFFSTTRAGSIVQRFGKDLNDVLSSSELISEIGQSSLTIVLAMLSVTYYGGWPFAGVAVVLFAGLYKPSIWYRSAGRQIRRLESVTPGLINAIHGETIAGTAVVRAFGAQSVLLSELMRTVNIRLNTFSWRIYTARWLYLNLKLMESILACTVLVVILTSPTITAASAGFILAFVGTISGNLHWILGQIRNFELDGVSLERIAEYRRLEKEGGNDLVEGLAEADEEAIQARMEAEYGDWPSAGRLEVEELSAKYGPSMPEILHEISFSIEGGQRVGLVGASGGGKSTLAKALFSFVEISHGRILIDGRDTAQIPLGQVRSKLGIIAQDPIPLSGTLRLNLDIESRYTDEQLNEALYQVQLIRKTSKSSSSDLTSTSGPTAGPAPAPSSAEPSSPMSSSTTVIGEPEENINIFNNLDFEVKSGGENLSAGQKQLVVLARALLKRHRILILDEATASIDSATDAEISRVVHEEFEGATVLIIAHRLRTITPCSKLLVMDKGNLVQQGSPLELIRQSGKFKELCMAAGVDEYRQLVALAEREAKKGQLVDVDV